MPLDPSIILDYRPPQIAPPQIQTPLEGMAKVLNLEDLMTRGQANKVALQSAMLQLQQQQQMVKEQQWYAQALQNALKGNTTGTGAVPGISPAQPAPAVIPPIQPTPPGGTVPQTGLPAIAPLTPPTQQPVPGGMPALTGPAPQTAPTVTPGWGPLAPPAPMPVATPSLAASGGFPLSAGEILANMPMSGGAVLKNNYGFLKDQAETQVKQLEAAGNRIEGLGGIAQGVVNAKDPAAAVIPGLQKAVDSGYLMQDEASSIAARGYDPDQWQQFINRAIKLKDFHDIQRTDQQAIGDALTNLPKAIQTVNDQEGYTRLLATLPPKVQQLLGPTYSSGLKTTLMGMGVPEVERPKYQMSQREAAAGPLATALARNPDEFKTLLSQQPIDTQVLYSGAKTPLEVMQRAQSPDKYIEEQRLNRAQLLEGGRLAVERGNFEINKAKFDAEYGPGTAESAVEQIYANPDSVREVLGKLPAGMYPKVQQLMQSKHGMPLPVPLEGTAKTQELAARATQEDVDWIRTAMQNPNIANNIGPILGNLQNIEQATGVATNLTGADAQQAQEFRNRMRGLIVNEAGALRSRGVSSDIINGLVQSSPRINMDSKMLLGALDGVEGEVRNKINAAEQARWGAGRMRPPEDLGLRPAPASPQVQKLLGDPKVPPGIHTINGRWKFMKSADGTITPVQ